MRTHNFFRYLNILILVALIVTPLTPASSKPTEEVQPEIRLDYVPNRLLARLRDDVAPEGATLQSIGVQSIQRLFNGQNLPAGLTQIVELSLSPGSDVKNLQATLAKDTRFEWVEPDYLAYQASEVLETIPNDIEYTNQWGLEKIGAPAAWDVQTGSPTEIIAIVDSGIDRTHPDLLSKIWVNPAEIPGNGQDEDNNGFVDDEYGWDFVSDDNDPTDDNGHGTQVAGVASAATNNTIGIAGTCWSCKLMAVKVMSIDGVANYSDIAQGVVYAADKGAQVINLSLGGYSYSSALLEAVQYAVNEKNAVVVAGAGNDDTEAPFYPAAYAEAIAVAGTDELDHKSAISNYGKWVDLAAPAADIQTTFMGGDYGLADGTSMAAPFVSGLAALLRSEHDDWSSALVRLQMIHTADPIDLPNPDYEGLLGNGRINAPAALTTVPHPLLAITRKLVNGDPLGRPIPGEASTLELTLSNDWLDAYSVTGKLSTTDAYVTITQANADFGSILAGDSGTGSPAYTFDVALNAPYDHPIDFKLQVSANGGAYTTSLTFTIKTRSAEELVEGTIGEDTIWTNDKTYIVTSNIGVAPGYTLTIEPGTDVLFNGEYNLNVGGQLIADGTEAAPIRFLSNTGSPWGRIYFDDPSIDATADPDGNYLGGNILRWVVVEGAGNGIGCNNATPYLSHLTTDGGGVNCITGLSSAWLIDSSVTGHIYFKAINQSPNWIFRASMPTARAYFGAALASNGKIYAIGGNTDSFEYLNTVEEYDPQTNTWANRASMPTGREHLAVVAASNGKVYAMGGIDDSGLLTTVEEYNPGTNTWTARASMPTARFQFEAVAASNGKIYAIGGVDDIGTVAIVEEYDPLTDSWETRASMPTPRYDLGVAVAPNGKIYAIGGENIGLVNTVEEYDPLTNTWITMSPMPTARARFGTASDVNGMIYTIGGNSWSADPVNIVERFDPDINSWTTTSPMVVARQGLQAVSTINGMIYAMGGYEETNSALNIVEEYNPQGDPISLHIQRTEILGDIILDGVSAILNSEMEGAISLTSGTVEQVAVTNGDITISSGLVLSNTITGGGIVAGDGTLVQSNSIENSPGWGILASGMTTVQGNRLVGNTMGIQASGGSVKGNLVANSAGVGLGINGYVSVSDNTFTGNAGNTIVINGGVPTIQGNNLEGNTGEYDIQNLITGEPLPPPIAANGNWWGTTDEADIDLRIFDFFDEYEYSKVVYLPVATGPIQTAPAYVRSVTLDPESPVGIETVKFTVEFSRPMDQAWTPLMFFQNPLDKTWTVYNTANSGLPSDEVTSITSNADGSHWFGTWGGGVAKFDGSTWTVYNSTNSGLPYDLVNVTFSDSDGSHWFGTNGGVARFDGSTWTVFNTTNSGLPDNTVKSIASDADDSHWFGTAWNGGVAKFDGSTWTVYNTFNSELPSNEVRAITCDADGSHWFGTWIGGVARFDGSVWTIYNTANSGLPNDTVNSIVSDADGSHWFGTWNGVAKFDGITWTVHSTANSELPYDTVNSIVSDADDSHWFGTEYGGAAKFDGSTWTIYNTFNSGLPSNHVTSIASDPNGTHWFGTLGGGVGVLWNYPPYPVHNTPLWLDDTHYQASFDITSLIELGDYRLTVDGAVGKDGMQIVPDTATTFTVDYAGAVSDTSVPGLPIVTACAGTTMDHLSASWTAYDPESSITLYRYAIGTTPGGTQVINWTSTSATSFDLHGLTLTPGQLYYISLQARNSGGLWSGIATPDGLLPGSGTCTSNLYLAYLSLVSK